MQILAHRGFWNVPEEKNSWTAIERAFASGFGIETDIRDQHGRLVISHDPPSGRCIDFQDVLALHRRHGAPGPMALNVKADGLQGLFTAEFAGAPTDADRSEEHTSELQSLMRISYAVSCLKKKKPFTHNHTPITY